MSIRSFKLKMKTNSKPEDVKLRQGLWATHKMTNDGIAYYVNWLALLRQELLGDKTQAEVQMDLLKLIREQQKRNNWTGELGQDDEILSVLRQLYILLVPSAIEESGDSKILARLFLSPLVDPNSQGGKGTAKSGRKPRWVKMKEEGLSGWEEEKKKDDAKKAADPTAYVFEKLESFGLKPLLPLYTDTLQSIVFQPKKKNQFVRTWDRDMFQQAIEKMLAWETWNGRLKDEKQKLQEQADTYFEKYLKNETDWVQALRDFESIRAKELEAAAFAPKEGYLITKRQIRGWDRVFNDWSKISSATEEQLWEVVKKHQREMMGGFGDPRVFGFLADPKNHWIWRDNQSRLLHFVAYNALYRKLKNAKEHATFTLPDQVIHPLWTRFDAKGGNLHAYEMVQGQKRREFHVTFDRLLWPDENGNFTETENIEIPLAPSDQFSKQVLKIEEVDGQQVVTFMDHTTGVELKGSFSGAKIQFDRKLMKNRSGRLGFGETGPIYLNLGIDLEPMQELRNGRLRTPIGQAFKVVTDQFPKVVGFKSEELVDWLSQTPPTIEAGAPSLITGMRIMSVDLGQRSSAAVSIFEVTKEVVTKDGKKKSNLNIPIGETGYYAVHKRSLILNLPNEKVDRAKWQLRKEREELWFEVRRRVRTLSRILHLNMYSESGKREEAIQGMLRELEEWKGTDQIIWQDGVQELLKSVSHDKEKWEETLIQLHRKLEPLVAKTVSNWRKKLNQQKASIRQNPKLPKQKSIAGLSMWSLKELENTRKLLISWSKRTRQPGIPNRLGEREEFATHLLEHFQNVKEDRLKKMAHLLVMTALGYVYDEERKQWVAKFPACQLIVFEDLSQYRFALDKPRGENAKLMQWSHRSIPKMVHMQGELYGLQVGDVYSAYSSRFHAKTGAPGIRCHTLTQADIDMFKNGQKGIVKRLINEKFVSEKEAEKLQVGDIVPRDGGEIFVALAERFNYRSDTQKIAMIHADINAAQNLQKRFWQRGTDQAIFRMAGQRISVSDDAEVYVPKDKKFKGQLIKDDKVYKWETSTRMKNKTTSAEETRDLEDMDEFLEAMEEAEEAKGEHVTFFRDPSGFILRDGEWLPQKEFWGRVKMTLWKQLRGRILQR